MSGKRTVLVVDDEVHIRRVLEHKFHKKGFDVLQAANGEEALALIRERQPDILITDISMPRMDGRTLCEQSDVLKQHKTFLTIIVTGRIAPEDKEWVSRLRDSVLLEKPFSTVRLLECVSAYLKEHA